MITTRIRPTAVALRAWVMCVMLPVRLIATAMVGATNMTTAGRWLTVRMSGLTGKHVLMIQIAMMTALGMPAIRVLTLMAMAGGISILPPTIRWFAAATTVTLEQVGQLAKITFSTALYLAILHSAMHHFCG